MANKKSSNEHLEGTYMGKGFLYYVDSVTGSDAGSGRSWRTPWLTLTYALTRIAAHDVIICAGSFVEAINIPYALNDITIMGGDFQQRTARLKSSSSSSAVITVRAERVNLMNLYIEPPTAEAGIKLLRTGGSTTNYANNTMIKNIEFWTGKYGVDFGNEGSHNVQIVDCQFRNMRASGATAIVNSASGQPVRARIERCVFSGNVNHIVVPFIDSMIIDNRFSDASSQSQSTTTKLSTSGGSDNMINGNRFAGTYSINGGYIPGTNDDWIGNFIAGGVTTANPA